MSEGLIYVTGDCRVQPGTKHAEEVRQAFVEASKRPSTIIILGNLFAYGVPLDSMLTYMDRLPGRKILVVEGGSRNAHERMERDLGAWHETSRHLKIEQWGMKFQLSPDVRNMRFDDGLIIHADRRLQDSQHMINASWDAWGGRFGPGGLSSLYALGVLAQQYATGLAAPEPVDAG